MQGRNSVGLIAKEIRTIHRRLPWGNGLYNLRHEDRLVGPRGLTWTYRLIGRHEELTLA